MRYVVIIMCFISTITLSANQTFALSMETMSLPEMASLSSSVLIAKAINIDTEAGNDAIGEQTMVEMKVTSIIWGDIQDTNLLFFLPEGSSTWIVEEPIFVDIPGAPKIIPGETYLLFLRAQGWIDSPFTGFQQGVYRLKEIEGSVYPVSETGQCIASAQEQIVWGGAIAPYPEYWGPYFNGVRYYFGNESHLDVPGVVTDDEGENSYPDDVFFALDPDSVRDKLADCLPVDEVSDILTNALSSYSPAGRFQEITTLDDSRFRNDAMSADKPTGDDGSICFVDETIPYSCEAL